MADQTVAHTPGPWTARSYPHTLEGERWWVYAAGLGVWTPESIRTVADLPASDRAEANARLIAVAPEMAEVIRKIVEIADGKALHRGLEDEARALLALQRANVLAGLPPVEIGGGLSLMSSSARSSGRGSTE